MTPKKKRRSETCDRNGSRSKHKTKVEHLLLLEQLEQLELADSCCDICHCYCYSSHSSSTTSGRQPEERSHNSQQELQQLEQQIEALELLQRRESAGKKGSIKVKLSSKPRKRSASKSPVEHSRRNSAETNTRASTANRSRRSKSAGSERSTRLERRGAEERSVSVGVPAASTNRKRERAGATRDCKILQNILGPLSEPLPALIINGKAKSKSQQALNQPPADNDMALVPLGQTRPSHSNETLCSSMANLCLTPTVRAAYQQVPMHDKKILNRMAVKRSQQLVEKEHAWLARKYWENERLERELLKCEQIEEYKRAVHDKQFQDYMLTKVRLQALAQRDLAELQRLREALNAKDAAAKQRIADLRLERDIQLCQRRCEELRRSEAVNLQQEEQHLDTTLRKRDICMRLTQRLRRADELRGQLLQAYLNRLQHDNYVEQVQHEEHWRERQQLEILKREQLKADIQRKRRQSQRFVENRQRRHEAITRTAKISASLRELVRQSVTPEAGAGGGQGSGQTAALDFYAQQQAHLGRLLFEK
ncbi:intersectin-1 [Scaptodrosophila lebanonensis]|uniref:Intersectin-1 n=1 Tax=Drosophila lebanonensis TaxID=7225 RepID=A0A6J2TKN3_DROLE|nr:intersectin-1 [Scaptodrosophila lebanonensis]